MDSNRAVAILQRLLTDLMDLEPHPGSPELKEWKKRAEVALRGIFGDDHHLVTELKDINFLLKYASADGDFRASFEYGRTGARALLKAAIYDLEVVSQPSDFTSLASIDPESLHRTPPAARAQEALQVADRSRGWKDRTVIPPSDRYCAAVCRNGHVVNDDLLPPAAPRPPGPPAFVEGRASLSVASPPMVPRHCGTCGASVLQTCGACQAPLLGAVRSLPSLPSEMNKPDSFCWDCGEPYPWATREQRVGKLYDRIDHDDVDEATLLTIREQIAVLSAPVDEVTDEDRVRAGHRIMDLAPEAWKAALPVLQSLLTAEVKRRLGLP